MILEDKCSFRTGLEIQTKNKEKINRRTVERTITIWERGPVDKKAKGRMLTASGLSHFLLLDCFFLCACNDWIKTTSIKHN